MIKKIGIIGAMEEEVEALRGKLTYVKTTSRASMDFYAGKMDKGSYKGFSGRYGSYAQKGGAASMLRLRMTAGCVSKEKLAFIAKAIRAYQVNMVHFTTCESVQFHNLDGGRISDDLYQCGKDAAQAQGLFL